MRWALMWQVEWLHAQGARVTLITDDASLLEIWSPSGAHSQLYPLVGRPWDEIAVTVGDFISDDPSATLLIMPAATVTDCDLGALLQNHRRAGDPVSVVRQRQGKRLPMIWLLQSQFSLSHWTSVQLWLKGLAQTPSRPLPQKRPQRERNARFLLATDSTEERTRSFVARSAASLAPCPKKGASRSRASILCVSPEAHVAPTARLEGPTLICAGVVVGDVARIGPWAVLLPGSVVGSDAIVERSVVGVRAQAQDGSHVYRSIVDAGAQTHADMPVLKARLHPDAIMPELLPADPQLVPGRAYAAAKRALDVALATLLILGLLPLAAFVCLLCMLSQGWPLFFQHDRLGQGGAHFDALKFRTMRNGAHSQGLSLLQNTPNFKLQNDPRVTRVGRVLRATSIDELPQLLNVLRGQMSLVGPRPIITVEIERYAPYGKDFLRVLPGLTGLWQVNGRSHTTYARRVYFDVKYGDTRSLRQDITILFQTVPAVLFQRGAH